MNWASGGGAIWRGPRTLAPKGRRRLLKDRPLLALAALLLLLTALVEARNPGSVTPEWVVATLVFAAPLGIIAAGQTLVILTGGIDLSVGTVATASLYIMATVAPHGALAAILLGLGVGILVGLINGLGIAVFQVQPLIMTLGMSLVAEGGLNVFAEKTVAGGAVPVVPSVIRELGAGRILGVIPESLVLWTLLAIIVIVGLRRSGYGRLLYATGTNRIACRLSGVKVWQVELVTYTITGLLSAVGGILLSGATGVADRGTCRALFVAFRGRGRNRRHVDIRGSRRLLGNDHGRSNLDHLGWPVDSLARARGDRADPQRRPHPARHDRLCACGQRAVVARA